ncbi:MAG: AGE family epimerase/isomerase [Planctomycetes bacterium]|nr:AGE family epimerase/isomerase [Planctomycetota bacterium]
MKIDLIDRAQHGAAFENALLLDTLPFWLEHGMDQEYGGLMTSLNRNGDVVDSDKAVWPMGRFCWLLATLHNNVEPRKEWLDAALSCLNFLERHAFDDDGKMFFMLTREGRPLRKRRYVYSEAFASMSYAACAKATGNQAFAQRAVELFEQYIDYSFTPGKMEPKGIPGTRPAKAMGPLMIGINIAQTLRECIDYADANLWIDRWIGEMQRDFCKPELGALMEMVAEDGSLIDHFDGRLLNPGHAMEAAWFILHEAKLRDEIASANAVSESEFTSASFIQLGTDIADWTWQRGWDQEHGGILYFCDVHGKPVTEYWHDMKFWWPHNEAILANLLAYLLTDQPRFAERYLQTHEWAHKHFADPVHGEWFGYLHRDGSRSSDLKGNHWKGPFHLPRMQYYCWKWLS